MTRLLAVAEEGECAAVSFKALNLTVRGFFFVWTGSSPAVVQRGWMNKGFTLYKDHTCLGVLMSFIIFSVLGGAFATAMLLARAVDRSLPAISPELKSIWAQGRWE